MDQSLIDIEGKFHHRHNLAMMVEVGTTREVILIGGPIGQKKIHEMEHVDHIYQDILLLSLKVLKNH